MKPITWAQLLALPLIPLVCVRICRLLRLAQGEKAEEIAFGLLVGLLLDLIYTAVLLYRTNHTHR